LTSLQQKVNITVIKKVVKHKSKINFETNYSGNIQISVKQIYIIFISIYLIIEPG